MTIMSLKLIVKRCRMNKLSDEWCTPQWLFDELHKEFNFTVDLCATENNKKCKYFSSDCIYNIYFVEKDNALNLDKEYVAGPYFMNPPYSNPLPFVDAAWTKSLHNVVVCLLKCDPSTKWWAIFWDHETNKPRPGCEVRFLSKRVKFDPPSKEVLCDFLKYGTEKDKKLAAKLLTGKITTPAFPSAIVIMDRRNTDEKN